MYTCFIFLLIYLNINCICFIYIYKKIYIYIYSISIHILLCFSIINNAVFSVRMIMRGRRFTFSHHIHIHERLSDVAYKLQHSCRWSAEGRGHTLIPMETRRSPLKSPRHWRQASQRKMKVVSSHIFSIRWSFSAVSLFCFWNRALDFEPSHCMIQSLE